MKDTNAEIYSNGEYLDSNSNWHTEDSYYKFKVLKDNINKHDVQFSKCLDVGCGAGLITEYLAEHYMDKKFIGIDVSKDVTNFWNSRRHLQNLKLINEKIDVINEEFDLVTCIDVFEHVEDYYLFLRNINKFGNTFIFNIPLDMNVLKLITPGLRYARESVGHLHYFNTYTARKTLEDCGFEIVAEDLHASFLKIFPRNIRQLLILPFRVMALILGKSVSATLFGGFSLLIIAKRSS
ncbi:MAG: class I SAM-dependent methyltransferase [Beijerinckiaceae bacterium]|nr:class I SAM-dependent methyltransferase [Beijerinckiaceae bacterium]